MGLREGGGEERGAFEEVGQREGEDRVPEVRGVDTIVVELLQRDAVERGVGLSRVRVRVRAGARVRVRELELGLGLGLGSGGVGLHPMPHDVAQ